MSLEKEKQLYVIFRGCIIDWYIPMKDNNEALGMKLFLGSHYGCRYVDISTKLEPKNNNRIKPFPKKILDDCFTNLKKEFRISKWMINIY